MSIDLSLVKTIVVVLMENRSFDNLLGYLGLEQRGSPQIEGVRSDADWLQKVANSFNGKPFSPFLLTDPYDPIDADPPHERGPVAGQLGVPVNGQFPMTGFVTNYASAPGAKCLTGLHPPPVMGYFSATQAPVTDFFARKFAICDHWFSSLPAGTQPNRLMAMSGVSSIEVNHQIIPDQELVYDWLTSHGIRWRVYHQGMPFFALMPRWIPDILTEQHFRPFERLFEDVENDPPGVFPQVVFVEPAYTDAPHIGPSTDDHAPSAIRGGQEFLLEAYRGVTRNDDLWAGTMMVVCYDEHGGFFDHVSPPAIPTDPPAAANYPRFESLGVRVPAFVISPLVDPGTVFHGRLDHTSILKLIGQLHGSNGSYSSVVNSRPVGSVLDVLNRATPAQPAPTIPSLVGYLAKRPTAAGFLPGTAPVTPIQMGFQVALDQVRTHPARPPGKFDDLLAAFPAAAEVR